MEANKILSASLLDLIFDDRNKDYGAYDLRATYPRRIKRALLITGTVAGVIFTTALLANSAKGDGSRGPVIDTVTIIEIPPDVKIPDPLPPPVNPPEPEPMKTVQFTTPVIVDNDQVEEPMATEDDKELAQIGDKTIDGRDFEGIAGPIGDGQEMGIIEPPKEVEPEIHSVVQFPARYDGNWARFLTSNLRADVPVENGAAPGRYNVLIQFVVDKEGNVSDLKPLTSHGFGMEDEAIRVLKKAKGWKPGVQDGREVKCYHRQPITFVVEE